MLFDKLHCMKNFISESIITHLPSKKKLNISLIFTVFLLCTTFLKGQVISEASVEEPGITAARDLDKSAGIEVSYPIAAESLVLCEGSGELNVQLQVVAPSLNSPFTVTIAMPLGILYVPGSLVINFSNPIGTTITESNITNLRAPKFTVTRAGGFMLGNTLQFTIARVARDCIYYSDSGVTPGGSALKDSVKITTNIGSQVEGDADINSYQVRSGVLSIQPIPNLAVGLGGTYTRPFTVANGGLECISAFHIVITATADVNHLGLKYNGVPMVLESQSGLNYTYYADAALLVDGICNGESLVFTETVGLNRCFSGNTTFKYSVNWGCNNQTCQVFNRNASFQADLGSSNASYHDKLIQAGTFCTPAKVRRTFINTSNSPSAGLRDFLDFMVQMKISSASPVTLTNFKLIDGATTIPLTAVQTAASGQKVYSLDFTNADWSGLTDSDGDTFDDDLVLGDSLVIEFDINRSCITAGCGASYPQTTLTSMLSFLPPCSVLAGSTTREMINLTTPAATYSSDQVTNSVNAPALIIDEGVGEIVIGHGRRFQNSFFQPCQNGSITITMELAPNLVLSGTTGYINNLPFPLTQIGNMVSMTGSFTLNASSFLDLIFRIPVTNVCDGSSSFSYGTAVPYKITNSCNPACCTEDWACGTVPPIRTICPEGNCDPSFVNIEEVSFKRTNYGFVDAYGTTQVTPNSLTAASRNTVIAGDTLLAYAKAAIVQTFRDTVTFTINIDKTGGVEPINYLNSMAYFVYTPLSGPIVTAPIPTASYTRTAYPDFYTYAVIIDPLINGGTSFPPGFLFEPGSKIEIFTYYKIQDIPTVVLFPLGVNTLPTSYTVNTSSVVQGEPNFSCGGLGSFKYYNYQIEVRSFSNANGSVCDTALTDVGMRVYINGTRNNVFPSEVRQLVFFDDANFTLTNLKWVDDKMSMTRRGKDPSATPLSVIVASTTGYTPNQSFVRVNGIWPYADDLGEVLDNPAVNGTQVYSFIKRYYATCLSQGTYTRSQNLHYRKFADSPVLTHTFNASGTLTNNVDLPVFVNTGSDILQQGTSEIQTWQIRYDADVNSTRRFGEKLVLAVDTTISDSLTILDIYEVNSSGVKINQAITSVTPWTNGLWAAIDGGANSGTRYFRIDYKYDSCDPDTARFYLRKSCGDFPDSPLDDVCGFDTRDLIVKPENSQIQFYTTSQPNAPIPYCQPLYFSFIYNSALIGNVLNPVVKLKNTSGIDLNTLVIQGKYPNSGANPLETLSYTIEGDFLVINLNDLANILPSNGVPGLFQQPTVTVNRQVRLDLTFSTDCNFVSGNSFELIAFGDMPCGIPAIGDSTVTTTNKITSAASSDYEFSLVPSTDNYEITSCDNNFPLNFKFVTLGTEVTDPGDFIYITLTEGVLWDPGSFVCNSATGTCPVFSQAEILPDGRQKLTFIQNNVLQQGTVVDFGFNATLDPELAECGNDLGIEIQIVSELLNVPCTTDPTGFCAVILDVKLLGSVNVDVHLPALTFDNFDYTISQGGMLITGDITNTGGAIPAGQSLTVQFYCLDDQGEPTGASLTSYDIEGPLAAGEVAQMSHLVTGNCIFYNGVALVVAKGAPFFSCLCANASIDVEVDLAFVCPDIDNFGCVKDVPLPYTNAEEFIEDGGIVTGFCMDYADLGFELVSEENDNLDCNRLIERTYRAFDTCGLELTCVQSFHVSINSMPTFDQPLPADTTVNSSAIPPAAILTATSACTGSINVTFNEVRTDGDCLYNYTLTRTWSATDSCNNSITHAQIVTVQDTIPPVFVQTLPPNITVDCNAVPQAPVITATDDSGIPTVVYTGIRTDGDCPYNYIMTRTWIAEDECGNQTIHIQIVTVQDTTRPVFVEALPPDMLVNCDAVPNPAILTATDNCGNPTVVFTEVRTNGDCPYDYTLTRTWVATDSCDNETVHVQIITVQDTTKPIFVETLPPDVLVNCDAVPNGVVLTATDNCGSPSVAYTEERTDGNCPYNYILTRTWIATDSCDNETRHIQIVTVQDTTKPVFVETLPQNMLVNCDAVPAAVVLTATDNCGAPTVTYTEVRTNGNCPFNYLLTRTWVAEDLCANQTIHIQLVTVQDTTKPVIVETLPEDMLVDCDAVPVPVILTATDNCGTPTIEFTEVRTDSDCPYNYALTRQWVAEDECGNQTIHIQIIVVQDTTKPVITINDPIFSGMQNGGVIRIQCKSLVKDWELPSLAFNEISASDNCGEPTLLMNQTVAGGDCIQDGYFKQIFVNITATDDCNNKTILNFTIQIVDTIPPEFTFVPNDTTLSCADVDFRFAISATDECECTNISYTDQIIAGNCPGNYTIKRLYTAADCCENKSFYTQTITVVDQVGPVITAIYPELSAITPGDTLTTYCDGREIPEWLSLPIDALVSATDGCSGSVKTQMQINKSNADACWLYGYSKLYTVDFNSTDQCGNKSDLIFYIKVVDNIPPQIIQMDDYVCVSDQTPPIATDNCSAIKYDHVDQPVNNECNTGTNFIRTWYLTDDCNNTTIATQYVVSNDGVAPQISLTGGKFKGSKDGDIIKMDCNDWTAPLDSDAEGWISIDDNCDYYTTAISFTSAPGNCEKDEYISLEQLTWTVTDYCGNSDVFTLNIRLIDKTPPYFNTNAKVISVDCINSVPLVRASDDCSSVELVVNRQIIEGSCKNQFSMLESYVATDKCGNSANFQRTVNVIDTTGPVIRVDDVICDGDVEDIPPSAVDNCTGEPVVLTKIINKDLVPCGKGSYYTIVYIATDGCGNTIRKVQKVIKDDKVAPKLYFSKDLAELILIGNDHNIVVGCDEFDAMVDLITDKGGVQVIDDCDQHIDAVFTQIAGKAYCDNSNMYKEHLFTWTATDACGNVGYLDLRVKMKTSKMPDFSFVPKDSTVYCTSIVPKLQDLPELKCGFTKMGYSVSNSAKDQLGNYVETRTWSITNECGETMSKSQSILHSMASGLTCSILEPEPMACNSSGNPVTVAPIGGTGPYTYDWQAINASCHVMSGKNDPIVVIATSFGTFQLEVTVTDINGCTTTCEYTAECIIDNPSLVDSNGNDPVEVHQTGKVSLVENDYKLRPNPTSSKVYLEYDVASVQEILINITDQLGNVVYTQKANSVKGWNSELLDIDRLQAGIYNVSIISKDSFKTLSLIKVK